MTRKILIRSLALLLFFAAALPGAAVLKEKSFEQTLNVLRAELERSYKKQKALIAFYEQRTQDQHDQLVVTLQKCNQISLILYSQREGFTFDMAYACQQATDMFNNSSLMQMPYEKIRQRMKSEVERYDLLIASLENLPPSMVLSEEEKKMQAMPEDTAQIALLQARLDSIAKSLEGEPFMLGKEEDLTRRECVVFAKALRNNLVRLMNRIDADTRYYERVTKNVTDLNNYAQQKYEELRKSIFNTRGDNYFELLAKLPLTLMQIQSEVSDKYLSLDNTRTVGENGKVYSHVSQSQWRGPIITITSVFILFYVLLSSFLSYAIIKWLLPRRIREERNFRLKQPVLLTACGFAIFLLSVGVARFFLTNNFLIMALGLLLEFAWMVTFILLSLLFRLNGDQIRLGVKQYTPFLVMAFIVILFRVVFIPNVLVNLIFPPLLLGFTIWQAGVLRHRRANIPGSDLLYTLISFTAMLVACIMAFVGYTMMAVEIMIWWTFQLACIQTITFLYDLCRRYETRTLLKKVQKVFRVKNGGKLPTDEQRARIESLKQAVEKATDEAERLRLQEEVAEEEARLRDTIYRMKENIRRKMERGDYIEHTCIFDFVIKVVVPILAVLSVVGSLYMAADMFDMNDLFFKYLRVDFVATSFICLSIFKLCLVVGLFFVFKYLNYAIHAFYRDIKHKSREAKLAAERRRLQESGREVDEAALLPTANLTLANNVITIFVWGAYFIMVLYMLNVPKSGITIITTGLATGMGFAMKDLLENFFYGLSLMTGRIRIGDFIECDGIVGKVDSITYQSTQVLTRDGCVIAFLNSQLFTKNFKNLTRNHKYELVKIPIGVAYGVNVQHVRELLIGRLLQLVEEKKEAQPGIMKHGTSISVAFSGFGDSSVDLTVMVWVLVEEKAAFVSAANEAIYNVLNENHIEIPFPQRDVHLIGAEA
ncbi:MAG: mechanosensitive ion channel domain-containing protein [Alloprevotella sp.]